MTVQSLYEAQRSSPALRVSTQVLPDSKSQIINSLHRDPQDSVVISPPTSASERSHEPLKANPSNVGIGVNIHRSKQGVFVIR